MWHVVATVVYARLAAWVGRDGNLGRAIRATAWWLRGMPLETVSGVVLGDNRVVDAIPLGVPQDTTTRGARVAAFLYICVNNVGSHDGFCILTRSGHLHFLSPGERPFATGRRHGFAASNVQRAGSGKMCDGTAVALLPSGAAMDLAEAGIMDKCSSVTGRALGPDDYRVAMILFTGITPIQVYIVSSI